MRRELLIQPLVGGVAQQPDEFADREANQIGKSPPPACLESLGEGGDHLVAIQHPDVQRVKSKHSRVGPRHHLRSLPACALQEMFSAYSASSALIVVCRQTVKVSPSLAASVAANSRRASASIALSASSVRPGL